MKKVFSYVILLVSICMFTGCSSNDSDDDVPAYNSSSVSRKLWGGWSRRENNMTTNILFWDSGKMYYSLTNHASASSKYSWQYNESTRVLATTAGYQGTNEYLNLQWEITLADSTAWTGVMQYGKGSTQKFSRASSLFSAMVALGERTWINSRDNTEWTPNNKYPETRLNMKNGNTRVQIIPDYIVRIEESVAQDKIFVRQYSSYSYKQVIYECVIDHPYSYKNIRVSCKWDPNYGDGYHSDMYLRPKN